MTVRPYIEYPRAPCPGCQRVVSTQYPTCGRVECERKRRVAQLAAAKLRQRDCQLCPRCCNRRTEPHRRFCQKCIAEIAVKCRLTRIASKQKAAQTTAARIKQQVLTSPPLRAPKVEPKRTAFESANLE